MFHMVSHGFPVVSHVFPMVFPWFSHDFPIHQGLINKHGRPHTGDAHHAQHADHANHLHQARVKRFEDETWAFSPKMVVLTIKNGGFTINNGNITIKNGGFDHQQT